MNSLAHDSIKEAELEVQERNEHMEEVLDQLQEKIDKSILRFSKLKQAAKNLPVLVGMVIVVGIFFGQLIKMSFNSK